MFVPVTSVGEGGISPTGQIESSIVAALQTAWTAMFTEMSFFLFHDEASPVLAPTAITSLLVDPKLATQRRRMRS
jgi:hypothetical protein